MNREIMNPKWKRNTSPFFEDFFNGFFPSVDWEKGSSNRPSFGTYLKEEDKSYLFTVDLPGVKKENLNLEVHEGVLTLSAVRKEGEHELWKFEERFSLPKETDFEKIEAKFEDGVLRLTLPKSEKAQKKTIPILN